MTPLRRTLTGLTTALVAVGGVAAAATGPRGASGDLSFANTQLRSFGQCSSGFDLFAQADITLLSATRRVTGRIPGANISEVASSDDQAYVFASGTFRSLRTGARAGAARLTAVDYGDYLNGTYDIRLDHGRGRIVANTSSKQESPSGGSGAVGKAGPYPPKGNSLVVTSSCTSRGSTATGTPVASAGGPQNARRASGRIAVALTHRRTRSCRAGSLTRVHARVRLRSTDAMASGRVDLALAVRANRAGTGSVRGAGALVDGRTGRRLGRASFLGASRGRHTDGLLEMHRDHALVLLNSSLKWDSGTRAHGSFGAGGSVTPRNTAVFVPGSCR